MNINNLAVRYSTGGGPQRKRLTMEALDRFFRQGSVYVRIAGPLLFVKIIWYRGLNIGEPGFLRTWERTILVMNEIGKHRGVGRRVA